MQRLVIRHLAEQLVACLKLCDERTPEGEIGILVPSVDDVIIEAEMRFHKPKDEDAVRPSSPTAARRQRRCQWLTELKGWHDCGAVATHVRGDCGLAYCKEHAAKLMPWCHVETLTKTT